MDRSTTRSRQAVDAGGPTEGDATVSEAPVQPGEGTDVPDDIDISTSAGKLQDLQRRNHEAVVAPAEKAKEKQHKKGRQTARERIEHLFDEGSFVELDQLARHRSTAFGLAEKRPYGDGVITGYGTID